jgi:hypothetical protein
MSPPRAAIPALCVLALVIGGCGGDEEPRPPRAPELTLPETAPDRGTDTAPQTGTDTAPETGTDTSPTPPDTNTAPDAQGGGSGGASAPGAGQQDGPQNDVAPRPGSPEERFEQFCEQNKGACG